ncbi:hypothetical protein [Streptomyces sp. Ru87]|nr:hypothetical protein [Streptomyces sp. Ru87]
MTANKRQQQRGVADGLRQAATAVLILTGAALILVPVLMETAPGR